MTSPTGPTRDDIQRILAEITRIRDVYVVETEHLQRLRLWRRFHTVPLFAGCYR